MTTYEVKFNNIYTRITDLLYNILYIYTFFNGILYSFYKKCNKVHK